MRVSVVVFILASFSVFATTELSEVERSLFFDIGNNAQVKVSSRSIEKRSDVHLGSYALLSDASRMLERNESISIGVNGSFSLVERHSRIACSLDKIEPKTITLHCIKKFDGRSFGREVETTQYDLTLKMEEQLEL